MRIGIVGGTFDPMHNGHLAVAEAARECAELDRVLLVPAAVPPHRGPARATADDRLAMARIAAAASEGVEVSDLELRRGGRSYTVDTLRALAAGNPHAELYLVLGWDAARELRTWRDPDEVLALARLLVVGRPGAGMPGEAELRAAGIDPARVVLCAVPTPDVSATRIRELVAGGRPISGLVPPGVERYVAEHGLYRAGARA